ncbi:hypothetical protein RUM43_008057 [Polyplax serrata]|uniref:Uncharacterized protein n=1 Tax=Polyplax serrata TaxID=468196 RepID=A0AAN8S880_POLSC
MAKIHRNLITGKLDMSGAGGCLSMRDGRDKIGSIPGVAGTGATVVELRPLNKSQEMIRLFKRLIDLLILRSILRSSLINSGFSWFALKDGSFDPFEFSLVQHFTPFQPFLLKIN